MDNYAIGGVKELELWGQLGNPLLVVAVRNVPLILVVPHQSDIAITELRNSADTQGRGIRIIGRVGSKTNTCENVIDLALNIGWSVAGKGWVFVVLLAQDKVESRRVWLRDGRFCRRAHG